MAEGLAQTYTPRLMAAKRGRKKPSSEGKGGARPSVILLTVGVGSRLRSSLPGVLHRVAGQTLLERILETAERLSPARIAVVLGPARREIEDALADRSVTVVVQDPRAGTGDATRRALAALPGSDGAIFVIPGDLPLLRQETLASLLDRQRQGLDLVFLSFRPPEAADFGRVVRDRKGGVKGILAAGGAAARRGKISEVTAGVYCFDTGALRSALEKLAGRGDSPDSDLTETVALLASRRGRVDAVEAEDWREAWSIRTRRDLAAAEEVARRREVERVLDTGATVLDPATTRIGPRVEVEPDVVIHPFVSLEGRCLLGEGCEVLPFTRVADSVLAPRAVVGPHSDVEGARIGARSRVGPFARVRPGTVLEEDVRVGNFVETKEAILRRGVKASHLSYLGDAEIGAETNIGAGVITCNYDGEKKNRTTIGRDAFIGSDCQLVAPVTVGDGAWVGAGSTITQDVPPGALALTRPPQRNVEGWAERRRQKTTGGRGSGGTG
jgi:bifunctional UDP-N-acetylglucosamine pyrophosphorylase/glucosamine-1-phosphate N-acetyltransferase